MKHFTFLLMLLPLLGVLNAQTTKGSYLIGFHNYSPGPISSFGTAYNLFPQTNGLGISFGTSKQKYDRELQDGKENSTVLGLSIKSHYFVADRFALGLVGNFSFGSSTFKEPGFEDDKSSSTIFLLGPSLRYYFDTGAKTKFWLKGDASFGSISFKNNGESGDPYGLSQFGGGAGISIFPVSSVSIDFGLGYNVLTTSNELSSGGKSKSINSGLALDIGAGIFF